MKESTTENKMSPSRGEIERAAQERMDEVAREFREGFKFLDKYPESVTFFGANQFKEDNPYYQSARLLSSRIVRELGFSIFTGGGPGVMEAANRGAHEEGGNSLGLLIDLPKPQITNKFLTDSVFFYYFFVRKLFLSFSARAFIFFPGGFGTFDEFFEILTLVQTEKIKETPMICVGSEYWNDVKELMESEMLTRGAITSKDLGLFTITDDHDEVLKIIKKAPPRTNIPFVGVKR